MYLLKKTNQTFTERFVFKIFSGALFVGKIWQQPKGAKLGEGLN
jgi:hypothetical protein